MLNNLMSKIYIFHGNVLAWLLPVLTIILLILSIIMIIIVLQQDSDAEKMSFMTGATDTYFSRNKGHTKQAMFKRLTVGIAVSIVVISIFITLINVL